MREIRKRVGGLEFGLKADHDFSWLDRYDAIFAVFDQQDSGNICFGAIEDGQRRFIKYAGAQTLNYDGGSVGGVPGAIGRLKASARPFESLRHPALVELLRHGEVGGGYALVFKWTDGESMHAHWSFDQYEKYTHPLSPYKRFKDLPVETRLMAMRDILDFHGHVARRGYVAVDFYDGSMIYDFARQKMRVCDIDLYHEGAFVNEMGRLWGSSRFMAPEEFEKGALIDEITNVYLMGATAFELLCAQKQRGWTNWQAGDIIRAVAERATQKPRALRYQSIAELRAEWDAAVEASYPGLYM